MTKLDELRELADEISSSTNDPLARLDFASQVHSYIYALLDVAEAAERFAKKCGIVERTANEEFDAMVNALEKLK